MANDYEPHTSDKMVNKTRMLYFIKKKSFECGKESTISIYNLNRVMSYELSRHYYLGIYIEVTYFYFIVHGITTEKDLNICYYKHHNDKYD